MKPARALCLKAVALLSSMTQLGWVELQRGGHTIALHALDADRVQKLYSDGLGLAFGLGTADPNDTPHLAIENGIPAQPGQEGNLRFWSLATYPLAYASGGEGRTIRLDVAASGFAQRNTWRSRPAYLADLLDFGDQEFTAYVRVHRIVDPERAAITLKVRGGQHTASAPELASCTMMTFASHQASAISRFGKELDHPKYDYVKLPLRYSAELTDNQWVGLKLVSFHDPGHAERVVYRLYVDAAPFAADGSPRNDFHLLSEYLDQAGVSTGQYDTLVDWGGALSTLRVDGVETVDVAILSVRTISASAEPAP